MTTLFIDGSSQTTIAGITDGSYRTLPGRASSDGSLFAALQEIVGGAKDLEAIAIGSGPGSHTGTRAAAAAGKGLAMGLGLPLKLFPSLLLTLPQKEGRIGTSLVTRRPSVYLFIYNTETTEIEFSGLVSPEELETQKSKLDHFGHDLSIYHLPRFLERSSPAAFEAPLTYLQF